MAEFEELRLTVNLVDNASTGLTKVRGEIGQLTGSATALTTAVAAASTGVTNLGNATQKTAPGVRALNQYMREASRSAAELKDGFQRMGVAAQGLSGLPQIAGGVRDMALAVRGLGSAFGAVGSAAAIAVTGIGAVVVGVAALGASVVAYGVSVFKFAKEMDMLGRTAKQMGMTFAELKYAQDEAKRFGMSAESITRSFQGVQDAQFDLWKNNSQLRQRLLSMGVDANWVNQLAAMDPGKARNAIVGYGKSLERQLLDAGVAKGVARALRNQFGSEFGFSAEDMDMPELKDPDPKTAAELKRIGVLSEQISKVWGEIGGMWDDFTTEVLAMGLPILRDGLKALQDQLPAMLDELKTGLKGLIDQLPGLIEKIPETLTLIRTELGGLATTFRELAEIYQAIIHPIDTLKKQLDSPAVDALGRQGIESQEPAPPAPPAAPAPSQAPRGTTGEMRRLLRQQSFVGGANDNNPLAVQASFSADDLVDETDRNTVQTEKLTAQLEKLNAFFDRMQSQSTTGATGGGSGGFQNASYSPGGGNVSSGSGGAGFKSGGGYTMLDQSTGKAGSDAPASGSTTASPPNASRSSGPSAGDAAVQGQDRYTSPRVGVDDSLEGRKTALSALRQDVEAGGLTTTSGYRDPGNALSRANPRSAHTRAMAFDTRARTPEQADAAIAGIKKTLGARGLEEGRDYKILDEVRSPSGHATGPHVHTQLTPQGMRRYQESKAAEQSKVAGVSAGVGASYPASMLQSGGTGGGTALQASMDASNILRPLHGYGAGGVLSQYPTKADLERPVRGDPSEIDRLSPMRIDRPSLDRSTLTSNQTVRADGSVKVDVGPTAQSTAEASGKLFMDTPLQRSTAGQLTEHGANAYETAKSYMASR